MTYATQLMFTVFGLSLLPVGAFAAEPPQQKPGLWEIRMQQTAEGKEPSKPATLQRCVVASD
jgi:hypothetical protein